MPALPIQFAAGGVRAHTPEIPPIPTSSPTPAPHAPPIEEERGPQVPVQEPPERTGTPERVGRARHAVRSFGGGSQ